MPGTPRGGSLQWPHFCQSRRNVLPGARRPAQPLRLLSCPQGLCTALLLPRTIPPRPSWLASWPPPRLCWNVTVSGRPALATLCAPSGCHPLAQPCPHPPLPSHLHTSTCHLLIRCRTLSFIVATPVSLVTMSAGEEFLCLFCLRLYVRCLAHDRYSILFRRRDGWMDGWTDGHRPAMCQAGRVAGSLCSPLHAHQEDWEAYWSLLVPSGRPSSPTRRSVATLPGEFQV